MHARMHFYIYICIYIYIRMYACTHVRASKLAAIPPAKLWRVVTTGSHRSWANPTRIPSWVSLVRRLLDLAPQVVQHLGARGVSHVMIDEVHEWNHLQSHSPWADLGVDLQCQPMSWMMMKTRTTKSAKDAAAAAAMRREGLLQLRESWVLHGRTVVVLLLV